MCKGVSTAGRTNEEHGTRSPKYVCLVVVDCLPSVYPTHCSYMERINDLRAPHIVKGGLPRSAHDQDQQTNSKTHATKRHAPTHLSLAHIVANANAVPSSWEWDLPVTYY